PAAFKPQVASGVEHGTEQLLLLGRPQFEHVIGLLHPVLRLSAHSGIVITLGSVGFRGISPATGPRSFVSPRSRCRVMAYVLVTTNAERPRARTPSSSPCRQDRRCVLCLRTGCGPPLRVIAVRGRHGSRAP